MGKNKYIPDPLDPEAYNNIWKHGTGKQDGCGIGYIIHMEFEGDCRKTLCGLRTDLGMWDGGGLSLKETTPGCINCQRSLVKRGMGKWVDMDIEEKKRVELRLFGRTT